MKRIIFLILILFAGCINQNEIKGENGDCSVADMSFINNRTINYSIVLMACDTCVPISNKGYRVVVNLNDKETKITENMKPSCWLHLLESDTSDWAANLILYSLNDKDALLLSENEIADWKKFSKKRDLNYWKEHLH